MCVCSAAEEIHWNSIKKILKTKNIKLADELEMAEITYGCKKGAVPPFGSLFKHKVTVYLDQSLIDQGPTINFNAGMRTRSLRMSLQDYLLFENPLIFKFTKKYFL
jgi:prolyl-tRNA editing enzyme YbaK/EbsC (Cys-tRNA(Pro) deacylase)